MGLADGVGVTVVLTLADIASLAKRRRTDDAAAFRTPPRADGPPHREVHPEQIVGNGGGRTNMTRTAGRFSPRGPADSFPMP